VALHFNQRTSLPIIIAAIYGLLSAGCASDRLAPNRADSPLPKILSGSFHRTVQHGVARTINLPAKAYGNKTDGHNWDKETQFTLIPAGPYVTHSQELGFQPLAIVSNGHFAYLATKSSKNNYSNLLIIKYSPDGESTIVAEALAVEGVITKLSYKNKRLVLTLKRGGIKIVDVSNLAAPEVILNFFTSSPVLDIQHGEQISYLLLEDNSLLEVDFSTPSANTPVGKLLHRWKLPITAKSIAIHNDYVFTAGPQGIASIKLTNTSASLIDLQQTTGIAERIQLNNNLAIVADGPGGLVVFQIQDNGKLNWLGSYNKRSNIIDLSISDSTSNTNAIVTLSNGSIMSINLSNPELPSSGVAFKPDHPVITTTASGYPHNPLPVALVATEKSLLRVIMTGNNRQLISPEGVNQGGSRRGVIRDNILYVADWFSGLHLYDISNPEQVRHMSNYHTPGSSKGVVLLENYALVGDDDRGLQIIDIKNPEQPRWVSELPPESLSGMGLAYTMKLVDRTYY